MIPRLRQWALTIAAMCAASACGDRLPTQPMVTASESPTFARTDGIVGLLKRTEPLQQTASASAIIGPRGGHLDLQAAGLRIDFARGAVRVPTRITVTALSGDNVAYQFEPHGLVFSASVILRQTLKGTAAWKTSLADELQGEYFERLLVDPTQSFARSLERRPGKLKNSKEFLEFSIEHFSGYMVSTGLVPFGLPVEVNVDITPR